MSTVRQLAKAAASATSAPGAPDGQHTARSVADRIEDLLAFCVEPGWVLLLMHRDSSLLCEYYYTLFLI